jgi:hypothetical protein
VSEDLLDHIDRIVFDVGSTAAARLQSLIFVLGHTQGFDVADFVGAASGKPNGSTGSNAMLKRKNSAVQLETLCEFVEHHLTDRNFNRVELLAKACMDLPAPRNGKHLIVSQEVLLNVLFAASDLLFQWSVIIALLMKESDGLIATALPPTLCSILLRLFAYSARHLYTAITSASGKAMDESMATAWESLTEHLQKDFPRLLNRFKDNEDNNLEILSQLLPYYDVASSTATAKGFKQCVQCVTDVFAMSTTDLVLQPLSHALKSWVSANKANPANSKLLSEAIKTLVESQRKRLDEGLTEILMLNEKYDKNKPTAVKASSRSKRGAGSTNEVILAFVPELCVALCDSFYVCRPTNWRRFFTRCHPLQRNSKFFGPTLTVERMMTRSVLLLFVRNQSGDHCYSYRLQPRPLKCLHPSVRMSLSSTTTPSPLGILRKRSACLLPRMLRIH